MHCFLLITVFVSVILFCLYIGFSFPACNCNNDVYNDSVCLLVFCLWYCFIFLKFDKFKQFGLVCLCMCVRACVCV